MIDLGDYVCRHAPNLFLIFLEISHDVASTVGARKLKVTSLELRQFSWLGTRQLDRISLLGVGPESS
jgi:hypothetical protein